MRLRIVEPMACCESLSVMGLLIDSCLEESSTASDIVGAESWVMNCRGKIDGYSES